MESFAHRSLIKSSTARTASQSCRDQRQGNSKGILGYLPAEPSHLKPPVRIRFPLRHQSLPPTIRRMTSRYGSRTLQSFVGQRS